MSILCVLDSEQASSFIQAGPGSNGKFAALAKSRKHVFIRCSPLLLLLTLVALLALKIPELERRSYLCLRFFIFIFFIFHFICLFHYFRD